MGIYGVGIYDNDTALEVKDVCNEVFAFYSIEKANDIIFNEFKEIINSNVIDYDYASFWYALADWQWKHGVLSEYIRDKALSILKINVGTWPLEDINNKIDAVKRQRILDKLQSQLTSPVPRQKIPRKNIGRAKHKIGDVIIFQATDESEDDNKIWCISHLTEPWLYKSESIRKKLQSSSAYLNGHSKYFAILCVDIKKQIHSRFVPNVYDEHSVYAFYDYCSSTRPSEKELATCGFLPSITHNYCENEQKITDINWTYTFYTMSAFFQKYDYIKDIKKINHKSEVNRFYLLQKSKYSYSPIFCSSLYNAFYDFFSEKIRLSSACIPCDTLISTSSNPELFSTLMQK